MVERVDFDREECKPFLFEGSRDGILLLHGFTGSVAHMRPLGDELHRRGYTVMGVNLPGHATTEEDMGKCTWQNWLQAAKEATLDMINRCRTVTVAGLSMGGVITLILAEQMKINACVTISAPMATKNKLMGLSRLIAPIKPRIAWAPPAERIEELDQRYDVGYSGFPTAKAADLNKLIKLARQNLFNVSCPILVIQSTGDKTIWAGSADCILGGVSSRSKHRLMLEGVPHVCTISSELPAIADAIDKHVAAIVKPEVDEAPETVE